MTFGAMTRARAQVLHACGRTLFAITAVCASVPAFADTTSITISDVTGVSSNFVVPLPFPIERDSDLGYDVALSYHTVDGTAQAGIDYVAASGTVLLPAGASTATIPVLLNPNTNSSSDSMFQLVLDSAVGIGPAPGFAAQQTFAVGHGAATASADINGDGRPDVLVASRTDNSISVLLNTTAAGATTSDFADQTVLATESQPFSLAIADINGDGRPDLVTANLSGSVSVLLNTTAPGSDIASFAPQQVFVLGVSERSVTVADINGDGKPDICALNNNGDEISVLLNTTSAGAAAASFAPQEDFSTGKLANFLTSDDIDGDGRPDLMVVGFEVSVLLNTTTSGSFTPAFASPQSFLLPSPFASSVKSSDLNGDGRPDLIVASNDDAAVSVLLNTTTAGWSILAFSVPREFDTIRSPTLCIAADINGDGKPDLLVSHQFDPQISVLLNTTPPGSTVAAFAAEQTFATGMFPSSFATSDLNGDGRQDLIVANETDSTVSILLNNVVASGTPNFPAQQPFAAGSQPVDLAIADINRDGRSDLIVDNYNGNNVSVLLNTTEPGAADPVFTAQQTFATGTSPYSVAAADVNGDHNPDLLVANQLENSISVLLNTTAAGAATPSFAAQQLFPAAGVRMVIAADINLDGRSDIVTANAGVSALSVLRNTTAPGASVASFAPPLNFATGLGPFFVTASDVNGDGRPDLIAANISDATISVLLNTTPPGGSIITFTPQFAFTAGLNPRTVTTADINGDGRMDLIVANNGDSTISVRLNTTPPGAFTASFAAQQTFAAGAHPYSNRVADIDGDGRPDIIVANQSGSTISILFNTTVPGATAASFAAQQMFTTGNLPYSVEVADLNGDGQDDLVTPNMGGDSVSVLLNTRYRVALAGSPATGTIVHDTIFANGFD
jgi:hypothetical protein